MRRRLVAALAAVVVLVAGCTGDDDDSGSGAGDPTRGGVLRVGVTADSSLDPAQARTVEQLLVADQLFDGLTAFDVKEKKAVPALAEQWTASPDQKEWDFTLRSNAKFSNGRQITATDVKYTLERVARKGSGSPGTELLEPVVGYEDAAVKGSTPSLAGITAPAPNVVHISLKEPFAPLPLVLTSPVLGVVPQESAEAADGSFSKNPVGSGPFAIGDRVGNRIRLVRARGSNARLDGIDLLGYEGISASYTAFTRGELDWSQVPPEQVAVAARDYGRDGFVPYAAELVYGMNLKNPKFQDVRFREAIVRAVDRRALVRAVYDDIYKPLDGIVVSGVPGFKQNACGAQCEHDVEQAKSLVQAAFPGGPPEIFLDYDEGVIRDALAKAIQADLKEAGITATLRPKPFNDYLNFEVSGQQELFLLGWIAAYASPEAFLGPLFASTSRNNLLGYAVPQFDTALKAARQEANDALRERLYQDAESLVLNSVPVIPILQYEVHSVTADNVGGLELSPMGTFDGSKVWVRR